MGYKLEGELLEVCTCNILCPCWVGEDPDKGICDASLAYHFRSGEINGIDVSGITLGMTGHIPGNVLAGDWKVCLHISDNASDEQMDAILRAWKGELGGPLADIAQLIGEIVSVERTAIRFDVDKGKGTYRIGEIVDAELSPYEGPTGEPTKLVESIFSTIPGSPAYVGKASKFRLNNPALGLDINLQGHNAISGPFAMEG